MTQGQFEPLEQRRHLISTERGRLLQHHPVLLPTILISSAVVCVIASFYATTLFPFLTLIGVPTTFVFLSVALVLGISGIIASIISILESIERLRTRTLPVPKPKGA